MRGFPRRLRFWTEVLLLVYWCGTHASPALAGLAPSRTSGVTEIASVREAELLVVQRTLEHKLITQKLHDYGVTPEQVLARLASLSDRDLHQLTSVGQGLPGVQHEERPLDYRIIALLIVIVLVIFLIKLPKEI